MEASFLGAPWTSVAAVKAAAAWEAAHVPVPAARSPAWPAPLRGAGGGSCGLQCLPGICHLSPKGSEGPLGVITAPPTPLSSFSRLSGLHCEPQAARPPSVAMAQPVLGVHHSDSLGGTPAGELDRRGPTPQLCHSDAMQLRTRQLSSLSLPACNMASVIVPTHWAVIRTKPSVQSS